MDSRFRGNDGDGQEMTATGWAETANQPPGRPRPPTSAAPHHQKSPQRLRNQPPIPRSNLHISHHQPTAAIADNRSGGSQPPGIRRLQEIYFQLNGSSALPRRQPGADGAEKGGVHQHRNQPAMHPPGGLQVMRLDFQGNAAHAALGYAILDADKPGKGGIIVAAPFRHHQMPHSAAGYAGERRRFSYIIAAQFGSCPVYPARLLDGMIKGVFVGLGVVILLALIPVVHFIGIPFGPFIAGYFGINAAKDRPGTPGRKALAFGLWLGGVMGSIAVVAAALVTALGDFAYLWPMWGGVAVFTFYYGSMSALGAWYSGLRAEERAGRGRPAR